MTRRPLPWIAAVLAAGVLAVRPAAQEPPAQATPVPPAQTPAPDEQPIFRGGVKLVLVDVTVTAGDDDPVEDLTPADFELTEDGIPQVVEQATLVKLDGAARGDREALEIRSQDHALAEAARDDVRLFAVFMDDYHLGRYPQEMVPLRRALTDFVGSMMGPLDLVTVMNPITPLSALEWTRDRAGLVQQLRNYEGRNDNFIGRSPLEESQNLSRNIHRVRSQVVITALQALVMHLSGLREGRKTLLVVSQGIPLMFDVSLEPDFQQLLREANRGNVIIHTLDPRGLGMGGVHSSLFRLAAETGGRAIVNTNDLSRGLERVVRDASHHYLIGYTPTREMNDGKFHRIAVKVKRRGARTVARRGYWAPSADEMMTTPAPELEPEVSTALTSLQSRRDDRVAHVETGFGPGARGAVRVTTMWRPVPGFRDRPESLRVEVRPAAGGEAITGEATLGSDGTGHLTIDVPPGEMLARYSAAAADGEIVDRWEEALTVPDLTGAELAVGSPTFIRARTTAAYQALRRGDGGPPSPDREFRQTDLAVVRVAIAGPSDGTTVTAAVLTREGKPLATLPAKSLGAEYQVDLPVRSLALGEYVLQFTAARGGASATGTAGFAIVR